MTSLKLSRTALLAAVVAFPLGALAQTTAPGTPAQTPAATSAQTPSPAQAQVQTPATPAPARHEARVEHRISDLHAKLHITPAQEQQWGQFAQIMRDNARDMDENRGQLAKKVEQMSAVDDMQTYAQLAQEHAQNVQKLVPAFQSLYASMSADQRRTADQLFRSYAERLQHRQGMEHRG